MTPPELLVVTGTVLVLVATSVGRARSRGFDPGGGGRAPAGRSPQGGPATGRAHGGRAHDGQVREGRAHGGRAHEGPAHDGGAPDAHGPRPAGTGQGGREDPGRSPDADVTDVGVVLELLAVATGATSLPDALRVVGGAVGGPAGRGLATAGAALVLGAGWEEAWAAAGAAPPTAPAHDPGPVARARASVRGRAPDIAVLGVVARCLRPAWQEGAAPAAALRAARDRHDRDAGSRAVEAAERLAVRVVVPLGLCLLPAFVLVGLVPAVLALGSGLL